MHIFDTHCHYNLEPFSPEWESHWEKAQSVGVTDTTIVSVDMSTSQRALELAAKEKHFHPILGCHPGYYQETIEAGTHNTEELLQSIEVEKKQLLQMINHKVVAIGETGLDYFRLPENELSQIIKSTQKAAFKMHVEVAQEKELPLVIHVRDKSEEAYWNVLSILKEKQFCGHFILHCVSGPSNYIQEALQMGAYLGLAGNLTYKNSEHLRELAQFSPLKRLLLETDAPFLPPVPHRGKPSEPWMIADTARYLESELVLDLEQLYQNSFEVFKMKQPT